MTTRDTRRNPEMERYVEVRPISAKTDRANVFLKVGVQEFCISPADLEPDEAIWFRDMLCIALAQIVAESRAHERNALRAAFRVNMLRYGATDQEIDKVLAEVKNG